MTVAKEKVLPSHADLVKEAKVFLKETVAEGASDVQLAVDAEQLAAATEAGDAEAQTQIIEQVLARELMLQGLEIPV